MVGPTEPVEDRENQFSTNLIRVGMEEETLQQRAKWNKVQRNLVSGDLVLVVEENVHRGQWPFGRVTEVYTAKDGRVRSAKIMTRSTTLVRPISKLCFSRVCNLTLMKGRTKVYLRSNTKWMEVYIAGWRFIGHTDDQTREASIKFMRSYIDP